MVVLGEAKDVGFDISKIIHGLFVFCCAIWVILVLGRSFCI